MENTTENTTGKEPRNRVALRLIQSAADAFVTWELGTSGYAMPWGEIAAIRKKLETMGAKMPDRDTLRVIGRYNGNGEI